MTPTEFEKEIAKFEEALKGRNATVIWDSKIPDPDNPKQMRQVDILIKEGKVTTIVECRHHKAKQDVKWIEEIYGRKVSLNAFSAIAVSSSGFTEGATKKAKRFGVVLRTFKDISLKELESWGARFRFAIIYIKFFKFELYPILPTIASLTGTRDRNIVNSAGDPFDISNLYYSIASKIHETGLKRDGFASYIDCNNLYCGGEKLEELIVNADFRRLTRNVWLPCVHQYASPSHNDALSVIRNESPFSRTKMYQTKESVFQVIDISMAKTVNGALFRSIECIFDKKVAMSGIKLIGLNDPGKTVMPLKILPIRKGSNRHLEIQSRCAGMRKESSKK